MRALRGTEGGRAFMHAWRKPGADFAVIGHRGAAGLAPENTMPSFELAVAHAVDAIELDVHLSRDGVPVVIHDYTVDRTTNGHGLVSQLTVRELKELDASSKSQSSFSGAQIPTLDEVLRWAKGKTRVVVELKGTENLALVNETLGLIRENDLLKDVQIISFDHSALQRVRALEPKMRTGALYFAKPADPIVLATSIGADALCPHWSFVSGDLMVAAREAGLAVCVWTVNDVEEISAAVAAGVDALTTDFPDRVRPISVASNQ
jgi:glycerophosphoryl diester phosphodiesterase